MKKTLVVLLLALLATGVLFAACEAQRPAEVVKLKVWASQEEQALLKEMVEAFKAANPGKTYEIEYGVVSEADAKSRYLEDPEAAADGRTGSASDQVRHEPVTTGRRNTGC